jgi:AcrR family transcriptional regulator
MAAATPKKFVRLAREQRVQAILAAALAVFAERGYENAAVSEIAERAGVVEGTVYKYFESKRALLLKVIEQWYASLVDAYQRDLAGISGVRQRLRFIIWRHLRSIHDNPQLCRLLFREVRSEQDYYQLDLHGMVRRYSKFVMDVVEEGVRAKEFRGDIPLPLIRDMVFGCIEHRTWNYISGRGDLDIDDTVDQLMTLLCDGLARRSDGGDLRRETERLAALADRLETLVDNGRKPAKNGPKPVKIKPAKTGRSA